MANPERRSVAIVDDDEGVRTSLSFLLEVMGHPVRAFGSAAEFLQADVRDIACLILDHNMPSITGLRLVERMRKDGMLIPIMLISGSVSPDITAQAAQLGIAKVVEKPPNENELVSFIHSSISRRRHSGPFGFDHDK